MFEQQLSFIDLVNIISLALQMQNQDRLFDINDIQRELKKVADRIDNHLQIQDNKIDSIIEYLNKERPQ